MGMNRSFAVGWRQVGASAVIMACAAMVSSTFGIIAVPLAAEFHPSRMVMMLAITIMSAVSGVASPFLGNLMDKVSLRSLIGIGVAMLIGAYLALSFATSFTQVMVIFAVLFAGANVLAGPIAATVLLARWFDRRRGRALGIAISGIAGGTIFFPPLIQFLLDTFAWREGLRVLALILFLLTGPALLLLVNRPADRGLHPDGADGPPPTAEARGEGPALSTGAILSDPSFWLLAAVITTVLAGMMGMVTNVVPMAVDLGVKPPAAALIVSIYAATGFTAKLLFAALADRLNPRIIMFAVLGLFGAGMACLAQASHGYPVMILGAGLIGIGGMTLPLQSLLIPRMFGTEVVGRVAGLLSLVTLAALLGMPPLFGAIYDQTGSYAAIFLAFTGLSLLAMLLVPQIRLRLRAADIAPTTSRGNTEPVPQSAP
jgi:MFS family permease